MSGAPSGGATAFGDRLLAVITRLERIDRRWIYALVLIAVAVPTFFGLPTPVPPSPPVAEVFDRIEHLPPRARVWVAFDLWASNQAEVGPGALAVLRHLFARDHRVVATSLLPDGASISEALVTQAAREHGKRYGEDYAILGYKAGSATVIKMACTNLSTAWPTDVHHTPLARLPVTRALRGARDVDLVFVVCDNNLFDGYAAIAATEFGRPVAGVTNAVMVPILSPYVNARQIVGLIGGLRGGAEYETLSGVTGEATAGMTAQSIMHLLMIGLIIVANLGYLGNRYLQRRRTARPPRRSATEP